MPKKFTISGSSYSQYCMCPHAFELSKVKKKESSIPLSRVLEANTVDGILKEWANRGFPPGWANQNWKAEFDKQAKNIWLKYEDEQKKIEKCREAVENMELVMRTEGLCTQAAAQPYFRFDTPTYALTSNFDLWYEDKRRILDLKTTKDKKWLDWDQLKFYAFIKTAKDGVYVNEIGFIAPLLKEKYHIRAVTEDDISEVACNINKIVDSLDNNDFPDTGDEQEDCFMCSMNISCRRRQVQGLTINEAGRMKVKL